MSSLSHRDEAAEELKPISVPSFQPSPSTAKKSNQPSKLVDLGAAATFANTAQQQQPVVTSGGGGDDLFGIFKGSSQSQQQTTSQGTGAMM